MMIDGSRMMQRAWYGVKVQKEVRTGPNVVHAQFAMYHATCEGTMRCVELNPFSISASFRKQ